MPLHFYTLYCNQHLKWRSRNQNCLDGELPRASLPSDTSGAAITHHPGVWTWKALLFICWSERHLPVYAGLGVGDLVEAGHLEAVGVAALALVHEVAEGQHHLQDLGEALAPHHLLGGTEDGWPRRGRTGRFIIRFNGYLMEGTQPNVGNQCQLSCSVCLQKYWSS